MIPWVFVVKEDLQIRCCFCWAWFWLCQTSVLTGPFHESELWKSKAGVLVYKDRGGLKIDLATGQN